MLTYDELYSQRKTSIVISNKLIQNSYFSLDTIPLKTLLYSISKINKDDTPFKKYTLSIRDLCQVCNYKISGTNRYKGRNGIIYQTMRELRGKNLDLFDEQGRAFNTGWFSSVKIDEDNDTVEYYFDINLMPYLFNLQETGNFTISIVEIICALRTSNSIMLYLFLRSIASLGTHKRIDLDTIRERTGNAGKYPMYKDLRVNILTPAIKDINEYSDIEVSYNECKEGKKVVALDFTIIDRKKLDKDKLDGKQHNRNVRLCGTKNPNRTYKRVATTKYVNPFRKANKT